MMNKQVQKVTDRIMDRSRATRADYLQRMEAAAESGPQRSGLSCSNLAHGFAACAAQEKSDLADVVKPNIGIISAYNDILSAHQPYESTPALIKEVIRDAGGVAQFAGGVPAMCDGVTQGQSGMELSLFSRDVIAMATAVALSHNMFDGALCLGICDKIVPGLLIGALSFGHLPVIFVPAGPMPSGLPNAEKAQVRQRFAEGKAGREELLQAESDSYHSAGTCTFYGTANSNQMLMEIMGLHLPGASFINPNTPLRDELTKAAAQQVLKLTAQSGDYRPLARIVDEKAIVNGVVGLLATGGSTNHTIHLVAIAKAAGIQLSWDDFSELSSVVPLLTRIYPNGLADVNHFQEAGGMSFLIRTLADAGLLHRNVLTVAGEQELDTYFREPVLEEDKLLWKQGPKQSLDTSVLRPAADPFSADGGLKLLSGNLGRAVIKTSAVLPEDLVVEAPAVIFNDQDQLQAAFKAGELNRDLVAVIRFQGPKANGMPELHKLTPVLSSLRSKGFKVALVTDGRMSGASGKIPAAIHLTPECLEGGPLAKVRNGDLIHLDARTGILHLLVEDEELKQRIPAIPDLRGNKRGTGRELFALFRSHVQSAEQGASSFVGLD